MIYFIQSTDGGPIKIGFTDCLERRLIELEANYGKPLAIMATMEGGREKEAEIHAQFSHLRLGRTEQFRPAPDLMAFISLPFLVCADPDAVEVMARERIDICLQVNGNLYRRIREAADQEGNPIAAFIRSAVAKELKRREKDPPPPR